MGLYMAQSSFNNFLGLPPELSSLKNSKVGVVLAPLENTTSFQSGTARGPAAVINASQQVELYDIPSGLDFSSVGAHTFAEPKLKGLSSEQALDVIEADVNAALENGLWPLTIGGEHTITLAPVRALKKRYPKLSVLQIDAHADLRETYEGSKYSHACIMKRVFDLKIPAVAVGIRNYSQDEAKLIADNNLKIFHDHDLQRDGLQVEKICSTLTQDVYLTVDIDGFTPGECPGTGTPEAGGITWWQSLKLFSYLFKNFNVVGVDINEVMPLASSARTEFFAAKLAYKLMGMKFFKDKACSGF
jgi:agmatinase